MRLNSSGAQKNHYFQRLLRNCPELGQRVLPSQLCRFWGSLMYITAVRGPTGQMLQKSKCCKRRTDADTEKRQKIVQIWEKKTYKTAQKLQERNVTN